MKIKPREWLLILVPLLMAIAALIWHFKPDASRVFSSRFYVESTKRETLSAQEVADGYDTKITVVLNHGWPRPKWWGKNRGVGIHGELPLFTTRNGENIKIKPRSLSWKPIYHSRKDRYIAQYLLQLAPIKSRGALRINTKIGVADGDGSRQILSPLVPFEHIIRQKNTTTIAPLVSRLPGLKVRRVLVAPSRLTHFISDKIWMRVIYQRQPQIKLNQTSSGMDYGVDFFNGKGQDLSLYNPIYTQYSGGGGARDAFEESPFRPSKDDIGFKVSRADQWYYEDFGFNFPAQTRSTFSIVRTFSLHGAWPLSFKAEVWNDIIRRNFRAGRVSHATFREIPIPPAS